MFLGGDDRAGSSVFHGGLLARTIRGEAVEALKYWTPVHGEVLIDPEGPRRGGNFLAKAVAVENRRQPLQLSQGESFFRS
jgi:hypothetical protein